MLGQNVGLPVNDTRLEVFVDFEKEDEARVSQAPAPEEDTRTQVLENLRSTSHILEREIERPIEREDWIRRHTHVLNIGRIRHVFKREEERTTR